MGGRLGVLFHLGWRYQDTQHSALYSQGTLRLELLCITNRNQFIPRLDITSGAQSRVTWKFFFYDQKRLICLDIIVTSHFLEPKHHPSGHRNRIFVPLQRCSELSFGAPAVMRASCVPRMLTFSCSRLMRTLGSRHELPSFFIITNKLP